MDDFIKDLSLAYLNNTEIGVKINEAIPIIEKTMEVAYADATDDSSEKLKMMRKGTVLAFSIINKVANGKSIKEFSEKDWKDIISNNVETAVLTDPQSYSVAVFTLYADYIDVSVGVLNSLGINKKKCKSITDISKEVRGLQTKLEKGEISEPDYTEKCLWLLLESIIKILALYSTGMLGDETSEFVQAVSMLAFEYGRYTLYKQENELLEQYLQYQHQVDEELQAKLEAYNAEMQKKIDEFNSLIANAFDPDFMQRFKTSVLLARSAGVDESEILTSVPDVDDFFS